MTDAEFKALVNQKLCDLADLLILHYDPCARRQGQCRRGYSCCYGRWYLPFNQEGRCPLLGDSGCTVRDASCKLWFCESVLRQADPKCIEAFYALEKVLKVFELGGHAFLGERYVGRTAEIAQLEGRDNA